MRTLQNSISSGRIAHAYLFTGPRGTGKTSTARLLAKALNCEKGPIGEPCNECGHCESIAAGTAIDVMEMDAASESSVDQVRERIINVSEYRPVVCRYKVFIIDEVHDLSGKAFDALLKTIEEPPEHLIFVLATTEDNKVPPTIRSRCQQYEFHRATLSDLIGRLTHVCQSEGVTAEPNALAAIARMADGGYRDALSLLEQAMIMTDGPVTVQQVYDQLGLIREDQIDELLVAIREGDAKTLIERLQAMYHAGRDPKAVLLSLTHRLSDLTRAIFGVESVGGADAALEANLHATAAQLGVDLLARIREKVAECQRGIREVSLPRLWLEAELLTLTSPVATVAPAPAAPAERKVEKSTAIDLPPAPAAAKPKPAEAPAPAAAKKPVAADPAVADSTAVWLAVLSQIGQLSKAGYSRLEKARVISQTDDVVTVGLTPANLDWVNEKPKFRPTLNQTWEQACQGRGWRLELVSLEETAAVSVQPTVQRSLEGEKLVQVATEVFEGL